MKNKLKVVTLSVLSLGALAACNQPATTAYTEDLLTDQTDFYNLINVKNTPENAADYGKYVLSDLGAWSGYALPEHEGYEYQGAFIGPMNMRGYWMATSLASPSISVDGKQWNLVRNIQTAKYHPGKLIQKFTDDQIHFTTELCFATSRSAVVRSVIKNVSNKPVSIGMLWNGGVFDKKTVATKIDNGIDFIRPKDQNHVVVKFLTADQVNVMGNDSLHVVEKANLVLQPGDSYQANYTQTLTLTDEDVNAELATLAAMDVNEAFKANEKRWNGYLSALFSSDSKFMKENKYRKVVVKSMMTLNSNYRSVAGDILHGGSYPSYNGFFGIWSWDSWKIASANALYNTKMAESEMLSLFDYQSDKGMVPDFIGYNKKGNNWRDTKPPLSAWGTMNVYNECHNKEFLSEMFDKIYKFHQWWYTDRDHDKNGICEYGSTDGSLIAAAWESGMDNGVRFDDAVMLKNGEKAWSMNQENICLNSFLYKEKLVLAEMATILNKKDLAAQLTKEAEYIKEFVQNKMFDTETGFFYDTRIETGEHIKVMGAECWLPLWAGIATQEQAEQVKEKMMDPNKFNSTLPLGTLDVSHPRLRATRGYWRGPVWVDQVYFGIVGLRNYGFNEEADFLTEKFVNNAQGLITDGPIHENYNPLTGETLNCPNFGWSSAVIIKMLLNK